MEHRIGEFLMLIGFLLFIGAGLFTPFIPIDTELAIIFGILGFLLFLIGVEIYLRTRKTVYGN
jgi:hypothetical protein